MIVTRPASNEGPTQRREGEMVRIDGPGRGDTRMTRPPFLGKRGVSLEHQVTSARKKPVRFSTAFCMWLLVGGPLL